MRLHCAVSDRVRDTLVDLLQAAGEKVVAERPGSHRQVTEFMALEGRSLKKNPDLVLCNFDGPRSFTVIDVKVCDPAAPTYHTRSGSQPYKLLIGFHWGANALPPLDLQAIK